MWPFTSTHRWQDIANTKRGAREELVTAETALLASRISDENRAQEDALYLEATGKRNAEQ
jgi:hypothetical protein